MDSARYDVEVLAPHRVQARGGRWYPLLSKANYVDVTYALESLRGSLEMAGLPADKLDEWVQSHVRVIPVKITEECGEPENIRVRWA